MSLEARIHSQWRRKLVHVFLALIKHRNRNRGSSLVLGIVYLWLMLRDEAGAFQSLWPFMTSAALCTSAGNGREARYVCVCGKRGRLSLADGRVWPLRSCRCRAALWWFVFCLLCLNQKQWETFLCVSAWQQSLRLMPAVDRVAGYTNVPLSRPDRCGCLSGKSISFGNFLLCYFTLFWWLGFWLNSGPL